MPKEVKITVPSLEDFFLPDFMEHTLRAYKEFLLALRSIIDAQIKKIEEFERGEKKEMKKIQVE
ncbi:MAG: hypothetical protein RMH75_06270 [Archaeoglobaceae archaeon]|nr:hypothetical protein [Archaeoglobaceae archaeon]